MNSVFGVFFGIFGIAKFLINFFRYRVFVDLPVLKTICAIVSFAFFPISFFRYRNLKLGDRIYLFFEFMGPIYVKLGQTLSLCDDIFGSEITESLSKLQDKMPPFDRKIAVDIIEKSFKKSINELFSLIDFNVVSAASVSQVYKAKKLDGSCVAIKILRPNIRKRYGSDIKVLYLIAKILNKINSLKRFRLEKVIDVFRDTMRIELNLRMEASAAEELRQNCIHDVNVCIPKVDWDLTNENVLTAEWIDGISISNIDKLVEDSVDLRRVASNLAISFFDQAYSKGFFHADIHPGNIIVKQNGVIAFVDFGIMGRLDEKNRIAIAEILHGFVNKDYLKVANVHMRAGYISKDVDVNIFAQNLRAIGCLIIDKPLKNISVSDLLSQILKLTRDFKMSTQPQLIMLQKTTFMIESIGKKLDPEINIWKLAEPWIRNWASKNITLEAKIYKLLKTKINEFLAGI